MAIFILILKYPYSVELVSGGRLYQAVTLPLPACDRSIQVQIHQKDIMLALKEKKARKLNLLAFEGTPKFGKKNTSLKPLRRNV